MACAWRNFKNILSRPLFTVIFRPKILIISPIFHTDRVNNGRICHILCVNDNCLSTSNLSRLKYKAIRISLRLEYPKIHNAKF